MWEEGQGSPECRAGWVGNSPQSPHPPSLGSNQSGRSTPSKQHLSFKVSKSVWLHFWGFQNLESHNWRDVLSPEWNPNQRPPSPPRCRGNVELLDRSSPPENNEYHFDSFTDQGLSVLYLQMGHRLLDPAPELVQKLTIVALGRMLHDVVDQVEQHQLLLDPYLKGNIVSEFLLLDFTFLMTFIQHLAILYADLLFLMHHPEKPCMDSWVSFKLTRIFMNFSSSNLSFSPALILRRSATAPPQHLASGRQDWLFCHFTPYQASQMSPTAL